MMNVRKLLGKMKEKAVTQKNLAYQLGIGETLLWQKLNSAKEFNRREVEAMKNILQMSDQEFMDIFFVTVEL